MVYTIVESAKLNGLDVYPYLTYLLAMMPNTDFYNHPELLEDYMPWSATLPEKYRMPERNKK